MPTHPSKSKSKTKKKTQTVNLGKKGKITIKKGTFTKQAKRHGDTVKEFESEVLSHPKKFKKVTRKRARLAKTFSGFKNK